MSAETYGQGQARRGLLALPPRITEAAYESERLRLRSQDATQRRNERAAQHPEFANPNLRQTTVYAFSLMMLVAAAGSDIVTLHPYAEYVAGFLLGGSATAIVVLRIALPALVLAAEIFVGHQRHLAESTAEKIGWNASAMVIVAVMPTLTLIAQMADPAQHDAIFKLRAATLVALTALIHAFIVFGGRPLLEAKGWVAYRVGDWLLVLTIRRDGLKEQRVAGELFRDYATGINAQNATSPHPPMQAVAFDDVTRRVLQRAYGYEVVTQPPGNGAPPAPEAVTAPTAPPPTPPSAPVPQAAAPEPPPPPAAASDDDEGADGEVAYLRRALEQRVRDADGEVTRNPVV